MKLSEHPTVKAYRKRGIPTTKHNQFIDSAMIKKSAMAAGAADAGIIELEREVVAEYRDDIIATFPDAKSILVLAFPINSEHLRSLNHSIADTEFKHAFQMINHISRNIVSELASRDITAINIPAGFPFEMERWPERVWLTGDKLFAVEAGLGHMGLNRLVIHPKYGSAIALASLLLNRTADHYDHPLDYNPCISCGLCVNVCPTGAVHKNDSFDFLACYTHNYREKLGGFLNWIEKVAESRSASGYRKRVSDSETISMWQHLAVVSQTKCDRCMAVCPAGEKEIGAFLDDRKRYIQKNVQRFHDKQETIYVVQGSDAELHVAKKCPAKNIQHVSNGMRPNSVSMFLKSLPLVFQKNRAEGLRATYHFTFTGKEEVKGTVVIKDKKVLVQYGHTEDPDLSVTADSSTWISFLKNDTHIIKALLLRKIKMKGNIKLMKKFAACFPS